MNRALTPVAGQTTKFEVAPRRLRNPNLWSAALSVAFLLATRATAAGQGLPAGPFTTAGGRLTISGEAAVSVAPDDEAWFNYSTAAYSLLQLARFDGAAAFRVNDRLSLLGDVRVQGDIQDSEWNGRIYALFARIRPWPRRTFDIQVGLVPPVFGSFGRRAYGADDPLIGFPLGSQYLTSLRPDALPASADHLLAKRGDGWRVRYQVGNPAADHGVPLMDGLRNPAGIEVHGAVGSFEASAAVTTGSLAVPNGKNGGRQYSGRIAIRPSVGLVLGASASHGTFLDRTLTDRLGTTGRGDMNDQRAVGFDAEYSRGHWMLRSEGIFSVWRVPPVLEPFIDAPLSAFALNLEGRYRVLPGLTAAARVDRLGFSEISGTSQRLPWDAPVWRIEAGGSYAVRRNLVVKAVYQYNRRDTTRNRSLGLPSAQLLLWF